eukprot:CAMPEP_0194382364 /NCGR_PEP_ID=MMETSP0174-20130528/60005_1 /TAXON_ID=216777 /ORGANISM="Proboscia alata, Strain PI-D3" /LENGTH=79 /DNA_ID=CAMNT_0039167617 /DNA_START=450 /DNA_END=689 /DNA_ORIENTATION=-
MATAGSNGRSSSPWAPQQVQDLRVAEFHRVILGRVSKGIPHRLVCARIEQNLNQIPIAFCRRVVQHSDAHFVYHDREPR